MTAPVSTGAAGKQNVAGEGSANYTPRPFKKHTNKGRFDRARLPVPSDYFHSEGLNFVGRGEWRSAICPFHADTHPSLRVNVSRGAFRCFTCGARGGDVLAFHTLRYGLDFISAAKALGAWGVV